MNKTFKFSSENELKIPEIFKKYPASHPQSAVMPLLDMAQSQNGGWLSRSAIEVITERLNMPIIRVQEVATFYSMYRLEPVEETVVQVCTTTPCWLRGSDGVMQACKNAMKDNVTVLEVQCLGACINAPVVQINDTYMENVTPESISDFLNQVPKNKGTQS
jgi:NADH-quinone oxidoreductase subunit E